MMERKRKNEQQQQLREKERQEKGVTRPRYIQDSTKIAILSENQLSNLLHQINTYTNDHGLDPLWSALACEESTLPFRLKGSNGYGSYNPLHLQAKKLKYDKEDNPSILRTDGFSVGAVVLASEGIFATDPKDSISHLCDNPKCVRVDHLIWESIAKNNGRKGCPGWVKCNCCATIHDVCIHDPKCKKMTIRK